ncbi:MAG: hypothetical protein GF341_04730 [candidate division Zixibacteria bacterium]|nr:hypothetical protein [candidate division Zixibacteria bacterium]
MRRTLGTFFIALFIAAGAHAQNTDESLDIFGYFQNSYEHQLDSDIGDEERTFMLQQLNLFFQQDISPQWRAFVNFEFINSFASQRQWGTANLEEAWVRYRPNHYLNLKLGLQIPIFNNLNEIKNRTPLLPYVIRPIMYETSFSQFIDVTIAVPYRTFVQAYGFAPIGRAKLDYAAYLGNSPNINSDVTIGTTGRDTSTTFLVGGRFGVRYRELKAGVSGTFDRVNEATITRDRQPGIVPEDAKIYQLDRVRFGADLSYRVGPVVWESEIVFVDYENPEESIGTDSEFMYGTLGLQATDRLFVYGSGWLTEFNGIVAFPNQIVIGIVAEDNSASLDVASIGAAYTINDRVVIKGQIAEVEVSGKSHRGTEKVETFNTTFEYIATAVSVRF